MSDTRQSTCFPSGFHRLHGPFGNCHILLGENRRAVIIDTGLLGYRRKFLRLFAQHGLRPDDVEAIVLTHGHLDHAGNLAWLKKWTGAPVFAHPLEQVHVDGLYPYRGVTRICGALEALGRRVSGYRPAPIDRTFSDGDELPFWGGLRVVHLPGHTLGHCGFWSEKHRLLFCADIAAFWRGWTQVTPRHLTIDPILARQSLRRAASLKPRLVAPSHGWPGHSLEEVATRLADLDRKLARPAIHQSKPKLS